MVAQAIAEYGARVEEFNLLEGLTDDEPRRRLTVGARTRS